MSDLEPEYFEPTQEVEIIRFAAKELLRRLRRPVIRNQFTVKDLTMIVVEFSKLARSDPAAPHKGSHVNILQIVQQPGLPQERRVELILSGIARASSPKAQELLRDELGILVGKAKAKQLISGKGKNGDVER